MAAALPFLAIAGTAIQGFSQFQQAQYQSGVAKNNAKIAAQNARNADYASQIEQMRSDREYRAEEGALLASQAASGLDVLGRSQLFSRTNLARVRGEQALDIRQQGDFQVKQFKAEQKNFLGEARAQKTAAWMGLAASAFDIAGQVGKLQKPTKPVTNSLIGGTR